MLDVIIGAISIVIVGVALKSSLREQKIKKLLQENKIFENPNLIRLK